jgi:hypothetical protein
VVSAAPMLPTNWTSTWTTITVEFTSGGMVYYSSNDPAVVTNLGSVTAVSTAGTTYNLYASYSGSTSSRGWIRDIELIGMLLLFRKCPSHCFFKCFNAPSVSSFRLTCFAGLFHLLQRGH